MDALASQMGAEKSPAEDYILGGADAPEMPAEPAPVAVRYPAVETRRPMEQQPLAARAAQPEKKGGWGIFGRKKSAADLRAEPMPEPRHAEPRAAAHRARRAAADAAATARSLRTRRATMPTTCSPITSGTSSSRFRRFCAASRTDVIEGKLIKERAHSSFGVARSLSFGGFRPNVIGMRGIVSCLAADRRTGFRRAL